MNTQSIWRSLLMFAVLAGAVALFGGACSADASFVDKLTFFNETDYPAHVAVSDDTRRAWLGLTIAHGDRKTTIQGVIDQGDVWVFRFDHAGRHEEELEVLRSELVRANWVVEVPQSFGDALQRLDVEPPP